MKTGVAGLALIKDHEGCRLEAYRCPAGILSIGFGSTENVYDGMRITFDEAIRRLQAHLEPMEAEIARLVKVPLTQNQWDAVACLVYNIGVGAFKKSTVLKLINSGDLVGAAEAMLAWNKSGGKIMDGLVKRRAAERELFLRR